MGTIPKGVQKAMRSASYIAKRGKDVFADSLPIMTIAGNAYDAYNRAGGSDNPEGILRWMLLKYTGIDFKTGNFDLEQLAQGTGSLGVAAIARMIVRSM